MHYSSSAQDQLTCTIYVQQQKLRSKTHFYNGGWRFNLSVYLDSAIFMPKLTWIDISLRRGLLKWRKWEIGKVPRLFLFPYLVSFSLPSHSVMGCGVLWDHYPLCWAISLSRLWSTLRSPATLLSSGTATALLSTARPTFAFISSHSSS